MVRRLTLDWPAAGPFAARGGRPIRWLAVSDDRDPALDHATNRADIGAIDAIVGAGDLEPDYLGFLADAFAAPLAFVRGNHDHGGRWEDSVAALAPTPLRTGRVHDVTGLPVVALEWPGLRHRDRRRHDASAWVDCLELAVRRAPATVARASAATVVLSHAPPRGLGDRAADPYHAGYAGYRWLLERWRPSVWLHGHVPPASVDGWRVTHDGSDVVNVTGAVLIEIRPPA
ncbi:MAG: metallophosphoesterase [Candidatus Limnocylindria bacterium]